MATGWTTPPSLFADQIEAEVAKRVRVIAIAMLNEVVLRSPVDTGRFRGSHIVSIGAPVFTETQQADPTGAATLNEGISRLSGLEPFTTVYIQTNLPYAERLENGHSKQAPAGIYGLAFTGVAEAYR